MSHEQELIKEMRFMAYQMHSSINPHSIIAQVAELGDKMHVAKIKGNYAEYAKLEHQLNHRNQLLEKWKISKGAKTAKRKRLIKILSI